VEVFLAPPPVLVVVVVVVVEDNLSPLPLLSSPLLLLFLFSLLLRSNLDTSLSSLPLSFSDEPGDLLRFSELSAALMSSESRLTELPRGFKLFSCGFELVNGFPSNDFSTSWATGGGLEGFRSLFSSSTMSLTKLSGKTPVLPSTSPFHQPLSSTSRLMMRMVCPSSKVSSSSF